MVNDAEALLQEAAEALKGKEYAKAEPLQRQGCELLREEPVDQSRLATELETLADIHCTQKKFKQCANEYSQVVQMREKFMPANDFNILRPLYRLAKSNFEAQNYESAEAIRQKAWLFASTNLGGSCITSGNIGSRSRISLKHCPFVRPFTASRILRRFSCWEGLPFFTKTLLKSGKTLSFFSARQ
jgi:tetratricopeptide (TPR) repeat protein